jgi:selT/selW/selH-like putative selenoprotein
MATELIMKYPGQIKTITLNAGVGGAFEVNVAGKKVWSKLETKQYPELKVVSDAVAEALSAKG